MATDTPQRGLLGRRRETQPLDRLLDAVRAGKSRALVIRGDPGVGKTALLEYVVERATGCRVAQDARVHAEMELAFAGPQPLELAHGSERHLDRLAELACRTAAVVWGHGLQKKLWLRCPPPLL